METEIIKVNTDEIKIPKNWNYEESVKKVKSFIYKWKNLTTEILIELWIAREKLSVEPETRKRETSGTFVPVDKTWSDYCFEIGSERRIVNRWIQRYRESLNPQIETKLLPLPKGKYNIIYADPPWQYYEGGFKNQSQHYSTLTLEEICNLPVGEMAADNCILFMWITFPMLDSFIDVLRCWGFEYSTVGFVWVKSKKDKTGFAFGLGNWTRSNAEICVIGRRGIIERIDESISQIIYEPKEEHSKKPDIVRDKIIQLVGDLPRIELFARGVPPKGWTFWGNEVK